MNQGLREIGALPLNVVRHVRLRDGGMLSGGVEVTTPDRAYQWDGMLRGGEAARPAWLFQYTLRGYGLFQVGARQVAQRVPEGHGFVATIPSAHVYRSDAACAEWRFFWMILRDDYVIRRLLAHERLVNRVHALPSETPLVRGAAALLARVVLGDALDSYDVEEHLFRWMLECERWADREQYPVRPKSQLLAQVRNHVAADLRKPVSTSTLARAAGLSRSNFSHHFRQVTGRTPAAYVRELRLEEVAKRLRSPELSVKEIAAATGFTSANQLCKCFRSHFQMSPGSFRRLHRV